ncbi:MAG: M23 family metallopeptidase [Trueperaceae bacterium]
MPTWRSLKPGWYLLAALLLYACAVTLLLALQGSELRDYRNAMAADSPQSDEPTENASPAVQTEANLWFPLPGAELPDNPAHLPGAVRSYRQGVSQGFDFYDGGSGVPVPYGAAVTASAAGTLVRVDNVYRESEAEEWESLLEAVTDGAQEGELDRLRGRQLWLETDDGRLLRYAHLSGIRRGLVEGGRVERGKVLGYVGNSGTDEGVAGSELGARLHFEVWEGDSFFGEGMDTEELRIAAASLFTGP